MAEAVGAVAGSTVAVGAAGEASEVIEEGKVGIVVEVASGVTVVGRVGIGGEEEEVTEVIGVVVTGLNEQAPDG